jgi:hypothetical protein
LHLIMFEDQDSKQNQTAPPKPSTPGDGLKPRPPQPMPPKEALVSDISARPTVPGNLPIDSLQDKRNEPAQIGQDLPEDIFAGPEEISEIPAAQEIHKSSDHKTDSLPKPETKERPEQAPASPASLVPQEQAIPPTVAAAMPLLPPAVTRRKVLVFLLSALLVALLFIAGYLTYRIIGNKGQETIVYNQPIENNNQIPNPNNQINPNGQTVDEESNKKPEPLAESEPKPEPELKPKPESNPKPKPEPETKPDTKEPEPPPPPADTDGDGLTDLEELEIGSNPRVIDTDLDGLDDYSEVKIYHSDPGKRDTDGDGYDDGTEVENGYSPIGTGKL